MSSSDLLYAPCVIGKVGQTTKTFYYCGEYDSVISKTKAKAHFAFPESTAVDVGQSMGKFLVATGIIDKGFKNEPIQRRKAGL